MERLKTISKRLETGRKCVTALITIATLVVLILQATRTNVDEEQLENLTFRYTVTYVTSFSLLCISLLVSVIILASKLSAKRRILQEDYNTEVSISRELCVLVTILMVFDLSYLLRIFWETLPTL